ncbi:MAG: hypothetical protein LBG68_02075 [Coriobacteriales bacterium]|jgi:hypothetical protein|nr:hypothetical protein [Coriobacteriales bacterium]
MDTENRQDIDNQQEPEARQELGSGAELSSSLELGASLELGSSSEPGSSPEPGSPEPGSSPEPSSSLEPGSSPELEDLQALEGRQEKLLHRLEQVQALEAEVSRREALIKEKETAKKQVLLRLSPSLWQQIANWAELDFRSINSQIEYILSKAVLEHNRKT